MHLSQGNMESNSKESFGRDDAVKYLLVTLGYWVQPDLISHPGLTALSALFSYVYTHTLL